MDALYTPKAEFKLKCFRRVVQRVNSISVPAICSNGGEFWPFSAVRSIENRLDGKYMHPNAFGKSSALGFVNCPWLHHQVINTSLCS